MILLHNASLLVSQARAYAEQLADLASWLGDLGLQADASTAVGEAYYNLQKYSEAEKWHRKSFNYSQAIGSAEVSIGHTNESLADATR